MTGQEILKQHESERQPCEIWTRVMGYHRPVSTYNPGKQAEHADRLFFREAATHAPSN